MKEPKDDDDDDDDDDDETEPDTSIVASPDLMSYKERRRHNNPERKRHGSRNQDKSKRFVQWLLQTFPHLLNNNNNETADNRPILDVAGGKGEVAARLCVCHHKKVIMVDPRISDPLSCFLSTVLPKIPNKWQQRLQNQLNNEPAFLHNLFEKQFAQLVSYFDETTLDDHPKLQKAIESSCLLLGLHADGATEAIVKTALTYNKPFVVVPCCVFPNLFPQRMVQQKNDNNNNNNDEEQVLVPVRTTEQFCQYLLSMDPRLQTAILPFQGRNVAIFWDGCTTTP
jgi:hypothetical protein